VKKRIKSPVCLNCSKALRDAENFCPACGQENHNKRQTFGNIIGGLIQDFLSVDSKVARSIPQLIFKPGFLTREYLDGRRQSYLHPARMLITIVVLYFILSSFNSSSVYNNQSHKDTDIETNINMEDAFSIPVDISIGSNKKELKSTQADTTKSENRNTEDVILLGKYNYTKIKALTEKGIDDTETILDSLGIANTTWNRLQYKEVIRFVKSDFRNFRSYVTSKLPWMIFALMPVYALLLKLLYIRRKFLYIDHLVFAFHLHSFVFLTGILSILLSKFISYSFDGWLLIVVIIYSLIAFKNFYQQSWRKTILKSVILMFLYVFSSLTSIMAMMVIMFIFY